MKKVLIANRGEIAVRIIRACTDAELTSVAVYSDVDADALHVRLSDEAYALPGSSSADTYLNIAGLLDVAARAGADAVHPGYGFLSENADFAQAVLDAGLTWIGPPPEAIRILGNKVTARDIAVKVGAPLVPGSDGPAATAGEVRAFAEEHGVPVAIKAAYGGGGRGMRIAHRLEDIDDAFDSAVREATAAFGRGECFVERFLATPRHVEAQVLADTHGTVVVVGTRDCSLQRRNQKLVEEAPAPFLTADQRVRIHESARAICREAGYIGAGTVEYLVAPDGVISFLEVNTRLQVEHPVTEATSGVDLVREQFRIAAGLPMSITEDPAPTGHAFEFRLNAEDPGRGFLPSPGPVDVFEAPTGAGVRVDTGVRPGSSVPAQYDSLMAKLIVHGEDRPQALRRARAALDELRIEGLPTVLPFHRAVVREPDFTDPGTLRVHTTWIEGAFAPRLDAALSSGTASPVARRQTLTVEIDGRAVQLGLPATVFAALMNGAGAPIDRAAGPAVRGGAGDDGTVGRDPAKDRAVTASMGGTLVKWLVDDGALITVGQSVAVIEAMKMETDVVCSVAGVFRRGDQEPGGVVVRGEALGTVGGLPS
ncbi:ATP-grasp domain-containing protein [Arthrobacter echini]|uniref:ATP-grasp domain-containing protein n=1 Tax=Arthrobacter echini TaxID=1529066 RepID=A0A4S5E7E7_9MICC|nr:biotin carboxylase N-terminal domain-containing protein [Arthrobacter echini]THJ67410.1 ATP-grasp domain-containing protein [Arthrobacter echini]